MQTNKKYRWKRFQNIEESQLRDVKGDDYPK
jgi:hypothetical protein